MTYTKTIKIEVTTEEADFCFSDLKEALEDGIYNVGNYTLKEVKQ